MRITNLFKSFWRSITKIFKLIVAWKANLFNWFSINFPTFINIYLIFLAIFMFYLIASWIFYFILYIGTFLFYIVTSLIYSFTYSLTANIYNVIENIIYLNSLIFSTAIDIINYIYSINYINYMNYSFTELGINELGINELNYFFWLTAGKIQEITPYVINFLISLSILILKLLIPLLYFQIRELLPHRFSLIDTVNNIFQSIMYFIFNNWFQILCFIFYLSIRTNLPYSIGWAPGDWFPGDFMLSDWRACNHTVEDLWKDIDHYLDYGFELIQAYPALDKQGRNAFNEDGEWYTRCEPHLATTCWSLEVERSTKGYTDFEPMVDRSSQFGFKDYTEESKFHKVFSKVRKPLIKIIKRFALP
jgi:hypothetical protein